MSDIFSLWTTDMDVVLSAADMTEDIVEDFARQLDEGILQTRESSELWLMSEYS